MYSSMIQLHLDLLTLTIRTSKPTQDEFFDTLRTICPDIEYVLEKIDTMHYQKPCELLYNMWEKFIAVKGHVQSGKTNFMLCLSMLSIWLGLSSVIVVRNLQSDVQQLTQRWNDLKHITSAFLPPTKIITSTTTIKKQRPTPTLYMCLGNNVSMKKIKTIVPEKQYMLCIDEVDMMDVGRDTHRNEQLVLLKQRACTTFGISATIMDPLCKERIEPHHMILLRTPSDYKGVCDIKFVPLLNKPEYSASIESNISDNNPDLLPFLDEFVHQPVRSTPHIALINVGRTVQPYLRLQTELQTRLSNLVTLVYHAKGVTMHIDGSIVTHKWSMAHCLQWLKTNGGVTRFPYIVIFSGDLAGRGLSFTDEDYEWHLTSLYLVVAKTCDEAELIQKIRLCGRYKDDAPLRLYTTHDHYRDLIKAYYRQEEIVTTLYKKTNITYQDALEHMTLDSEKFTKRRMTKHTPLLVQKANPSETEWSSLVYQGLQHPPRSAFEAYGEDVSKAGTVSLLGIDLANEREDDSTELEQDEMKRLSDKMFPSWSKRLGETRISSWMDALEPERLYTRKDMTDLCKTHDITLQHVLVTKYEKSGSRGYGRILQVHDSMYRLQPDLVKAHQLHFH